MKAPGEERNLEEERRERDRFLILQHALTLAEADPTAVLPGCLVWQQLGFCRSEGLSLIDELVRAGYLRERCPGPRVSLTPQGIDYVKRRAGRRRSVRLRSRRAWIPSAGGQAFSPVPRGAGGRSPARR